MAESATEAKPKRLAIIDGKSVFYRGYYAMPNLSTKDGVPTGGVFGFATMALEVIRRLKPDYVAVAWDKPKTNIRKRLELYSEYKAGRKPAPADFYEQIPVLHELLQAFGWPLYEMDDYEADDLMGTLAAQASNQGIETLLITSDLDALQLVGPLTKVYALKTGLSNIELYSPESFTAKYGIDVQQFLDLKALKGDSSDNIPGVPGIGEKTAVQLLQEFKTLDGVYDNLGLIKDSVRRKLEAGKDSAYLSKKLGAIWCDAPLALDLSEVDGSKVNPERLKHLLEKLEFRSLLRQLPEVMQTAIDNHEQKTGTGNPLKAGKPVLITDETQLAGMEIATGKRLYVHSRAAGGHGHNPQVLILSTDGKTVYVLDLTKLDPEAVALKLAALAIDEGIVGYDVKSTLEVLLNLGLLKLPPVAHDILIGAFLLNSLRREQSLTELAQVDLGYDGSPFEDLDAEEVMARGPEIIAAVRALHEQQAGELQSIPKLTELAREVEWPVIPVLARMEYAGIELDTAYLHTFAAELNDSISDIEQQIYGLAGQEFNIGSPTQLADILFNQLKLPATGIKRGKTGYSTAANELDKLRGQHEIIDLITQYREVAKLKNTYVDTLPAMVDEHSRVHTTFNLTIAQTGRLSSTDPNLQNIPTRTDLGRRIRTAFVAGKGKKLVSADYSQFELRLAAAMSGDDDMVAMFNRGADIHATTAAKIYGRELEDVTKQMRSAAKTVNFGVLYGMSAHGLSIATGMNRQQAQNFIDAYFELRKPLLGYLNSLKEQARRDGYVQTLHGRRRLMPDIHSSNFAVRQAAERAAMNMPIQGTEADLMKLAMVAVDKELEKFNGEPRDTGHEARGATVSRHRGQDAEVTSDRHGISPQGRNDTGSELRDSADAPRQLLQVHDSILVECDETDAQTVADILKRTMENVYTELPVKLLVDVKIGDNWGEL